MNIECAPEIIRIDEAELLTYSETLAIEASMEIVDKLYVIGQHLDYYHDKQDRDSKEIKAELKRNRAIHLYDLLELRYFNPETGISVKLIKHPDEQLHDYSQNRIIITAESSASRSDSKIPPETFVTNLDILANTGNGKTSSHILNLIGAPDEIEGEEIYKTLDRTFEELHGVEKAYVLAVEEGDEQKIKITDHIRNFVLPHRLRLLRENNGVLISFDERNNTFNFFIGNRTN